MRNINQEIRIREIDDKPAIQSWYAVPGILLCCVPLVMLVTDALSDKMTTMQYFLYPVLCRSVMAISTIFFLIQTFKTRNIVHCGSSEDHEHIKNRASVLSPLDRVKEYVASNGKYQTVIWAAFILWMIISTCINGITGEALFSVPYRYVGVIDLIIFIVVYMGCSSRIESEKMRNMILILYMTVADTVSLVFLFDWFIKDIPSISSENVGSAIFYHDNHYGYFLVIAILISVGYVVYGSLKIMTAGLGSLAINLLALVLNRTSGCFIAVGAAIIMMLIYILIYDRAFSRRSLILAVIFAIGAIYAVAASEALRDDLALVVRDAYAILSGGDTRYAGHGRWQLWKITADYLVDEPFFGYGCEGIANTLYDYTEAANPHNEPLTYAVFFGIPAGIIYVVGCLTAIRDGLIDSYSGKNNIMSGYNRSVSKGRGVRIAAFAALGYFISSLFGVEMFYTEPYMFILLGIATSNNSRRNYNYYQYDLDANLS